MEVLSGGCAGLLCSVPPEKVWLGDAYGVGGSTHGSWISAEKRQGRGSTARHPAGGRMLCSSPPEENPQREEESHVPSAKWHMTQTKEKKKNHTSLLHRFISLCRGLTTSTRCSSSQLRYWILGHPRNCHKWEMIPQHLACVNTDSECLSIHLRKERMCSVCSQKQPGKF